MNNMIPIDIILVTFNRLNFLKETVEKIYERTRYPYRLIVVDNASTDGTQEWLKSAKLSGHVQEYVFLEENNGYAVGLNAGFELVKSDYVVTTQDDLLPPDMKPCWLERLLHLKEKYPDYVGISMRIQRIRHRQVDEFKDLIDSKPSLASIFRICSTEDIKKINGFGKRPHWESTSFAQRTEKLKKKLGVATHLYADHTGFMPANKGFKEGFTDYHTYAANRITQGDDQPYPDIDPRSQIPLKTNTIRDDKEQAKRQDYYDYWGHDDRFGKNRNRLTVEQKELAKYCEKGNGLDLGCGYMKCHPNAIGMDVYPHERVDIVGDCTDLWMFKDDELDFIVNAHLLEHLPDTPAVLKEWKRVLKPGGILAIAVPDGEIKPKYISKNGHKTNLGLNTLKILFKHVVGGFRIIKAEHVPKLPGKYVALIVAKKK